jgi:Chaperone of endosialidase
MMNKTRPENKTFATLMDVIEQSGMTTAAAAITSQLVGSDDILTDGGAGGSSASMNPLEDDIFDSDLRLKTDIRKVGTTVYGLPLYHFRYNGQETVYEGVMAQDVVDVMPSAVLQGADGFLRVNYGSLGISMRQVA